MLEIENDQRFQVCQKTNIVKIGKWAYYQNVHLEGNPAWAHFFGDNYVCTIYADTFFRLVVKEGNFLSENANVVVDCFFDTFEKAIKYSELYTN